MFEIDRAAGLVNEGDDTRLQNVMRRAAAGERLTVGFIGGSITQGSLASVPENCYAYRVYSWWRDTFAKADVTYLNAGIGATTSQFGAARVRTDLLIHHPDVVFVEFSVNDESNEHFLETYEGLVRQILAAENAPAVVLIHNVCYNNGASAQLIHQRVGRHYGLPCVSMQNTIYPELLSGRIPNREITPDDLHPNDAGHELVASVITCYLEKVRDRVLAGNADKREKEAAEREMPAPFTLNSYERSVRIDCCSIPELREDFPALIEAEGFAPDLRPKQGVTDNFKNGWTASAAGAHMVFELEGTGVSVQFRRSVNQPAPIAEIVVDQDPATRKILDANFDETWGDKLELLTVTEHMPRGIHRVEVRLIETHADDAVPFYLNAVIMAN
ncbi:MAG: SGNH/GDSL hydrolase family protein [Lachnospiraceae bacterium]|nr:SGNH/GDSL hydrolase family protein [Lachnospiraceae bacterium]